MIDIVNQNDIEHLIRTDKTIAFIYERYGHPPNWTRPPGFVSLSKIILEQQVSLASAKAHFKKLDNYLLEFTPENILRLTDVEMRNCQVSRQKASYLRALSIAIVEGELKLDKLSDKSEHEIRSRLTNIKGIGEWTTDVYLMFCLQAKDIFPIGDIALVNAAKELIDAATKEEVIAHAAAWKPFRSLAAYFLWHYYLKKRNRPSILEI